MILIFREILPQLQRTYYKDECSVYNYINRASAPESFRRKCFYKYIEVFKLVLLEPSSCCSLIVNQRPQRKSFVIVFVAYSHRNSNRKRQGQEIGLTEPEGLGTLYVDGL